MTALRPGQSPPPVSIATRMRPTLPSGVLPVTDLSASFPFLEAAPTGAAVARAARCEAARAGDTDHGGRDDETCPRTLLDSPADVRGHRHRRRHDRGAQLRPAGRRVA